jgi:hypothetical protein
VDGTDLFAEILTLAEAAAMLGLAPGTLRIQARKGRLGARIVGKTYVTTRSEVPPGWEPKPRPSPKGFSKWSEIKRRKGAE